MRARWLSYYVNMQKAKLLKLGKKERFNRFIKNGANDFQKRLASQWLLFVPVILAILILFFIFPIDITIYSYFPPIINPSNDYYLTLWQVYGALIGLSFVVLFFFYEAFIGRISSEYKKLEFRFRQEFYRRTALQPLLFFNLISLVYVGLVINIPSRSLQSITLLVISILSVCLLFARAVRFFDGDQMEKTRLSILKGEISASIEAEVDRRISASVLHIINEKSAFLKYSPLDLEEINTTPIKLLVSDRARIADLAIDKISANAESQKTIVTLKKGIGEIVSSKYSVAGFVAKETDVKTVRVLQRCFKIKKEPSRRDLQLVFDDLEEQLILAVSRQSSRDLTKCLEIYQYSIEELLRTFHLYGINYTPERARQGDFLSEWEPISRIGTDFHHLIEISIEAGNREIIRSIVFFIEDLLKISKENDDFLVLHRFKDYWLFIYYIALDTPDKALRNFIVETLLRNMKTFVNNLLLHLQFSSVTEQEVFSYQEFAITSILLYEQFLKATVEKGAVDYWTIIEKSLADISSEYEPEEKRPYSYEIDAKLMDTSLSEEEKNNLNNMLKSLQAKLSLKAEIDCLIPEIWLGIGGWITELYVKDKITREDACRFIGLVLKRFKDIKCLSLAYNSTADSPVNSKYSKHAWQWWELEDKTGAIMTLGSHEEWITRFYCITGLMLIPLQINPGDSIEPTAEATSNLNAVKRQVTELSGQYDSWAPMINTTKSEYDNKLQNFVKAHERAVEKQKDIDSKWLRQQPLDEEKIAKFKTEVTTAWKNQSHIRAIIEKRGNFVDKTKILDSIQPIGVQNRAPKDAFVSDEYKSCMFIQNFGTDIGNYENSMIGSKISSSSSVNSTDEASLFENIKLSLGNLKEKGYSPNVIFVGKQKLIRLLTKAKEFQPSWKMKIVDINLQGVEGYFEGIPVFVFGEIGDEKIIVVDLKKVGTLTQYRVKKEDVDFLNFDFTFINEETAKKYITQNPKLLENEKGEKLLEEQVSNSLQEEVYLKIFERFEFTIDDSNASTTLALKSTPTTKP
jgi:hypothetical protein